MYDSVDQPKNHNSVNHPKHYNEGQYECFDVMVDVFGAEAVQDFCIINAFKYLWRFKYKNGVEDIDKAIWYLEHYKELGDGE